MMRKAGSGMGRGLREWRTYKAIATHDLLERIEIVEEDRVFAVTARHVSAAAIARRLQFDRVAKDTLHGSGNLLGRAHRDAQPFALDHAVRIDHGHDRNAAL